MKPLSLTTFSVGPSDKYAAVDVYQSGGELVNSIQDQQTSGLSFDPRSLLANGGRGSIGSAGSLLKLTSGGGVGLNASSILSRLSSSAPMIASSLRSMTQSAQSSIAGTFQNSGLMNFKMGANTFQVPSSSFSDVTAFGDYATSVNDYGTSLSLTSSDPFSCSAYDIDAHASMVSGAIIQGSNLGIPASYGFMTQNAGVSGNTSLLTKVCTAAIPILVKNGDLGNLGDLSSGVGGKVLAAAFPSYASTLRNNYSYNTYGRSTGAPLSDYTNLVRIFTGCDPQWNIFDRIGDATGQSGTSTWNAIKLIGGSREFNELIAIGVKNLVEGDPDWWQVVARTLPQTTVDQEIRIYFPRVWQESYANPQIRRKPSVVDARIASLAGKALGTIIAGKTQRAYNSSPNYSPGYTPPVTPSMPSYPTGILSEDSPPAYDNYSPQQDFPTNTSQPTEVVASDVFDGSEFF